MKIKDIALSAAYVGQRAVKAICVGAQEVWSAIKYIVFKDPMVAQICATNWGDGVGITEEDAAKVTSIGGVFSGNADITSFDELVEFENVTELKLEAFRGCTSLTSIDLSNITAFGNFAFLGCSSLSMNLSFTTLTKFGGESVFQSTGVKSLYAQLLETAERGMFNVCKDFTGELNFPNLKGEIGNAWMQGTAITKIIDLGTVTSIVGSVGNGAFCYCKSLTYANMPATLTNIGAYTFQGCSALETIVFNSVIPPTLDNASAFWNNPLMTIYVPDASVDAYKSASNWSAYADRIKPLSLYVEPTNE
jgi:hypothetical protein